MNYPTYRIRVNNFLEADAPQKATVDLPIDYDDVVDAAEAGWAVIAALAQLYDLDFENQGDQYMAYYRDGHPQEGEGAITVQLFDNRGKQYERL
jgi:hypothetical protein